MSLMRLIETEREYADKRDDAAQKIKFEGVSLIIRGQDFWSGPCSPEERGHWQRGYFVDGGS
jgi:hypothetical protein